MYADYAFKGGIDFIDEHFGAFLIAAFASVGLCTLGRLFGGTSVHGPFFLIFLPMLSSDATVTIRAHADLVEEIPNDTEQSLWGAD
jgi:hypothetical protein